MEGALNMTLLYGGIIAVWIGLGIIALAAAISGGRAEKYIDAGGDDE